MMARISIDSQHHPFFKELAGRDRELVFDSMKDLFVLCAALGLQNGVKVPLKKREDIFDSGFFNADEWAAFEAAYVAQTGDVQHLDVPAAERRSNNSVIEFIEEFANAGVGIMKTEFDPARPEIDLALMLLKAPETKA